MCPLYIYFVTHSSWLDGVCCRLAAGYHGHVFVNQPDVRSSVPQQQKRDCRSVARVSYAENRLFSPRARVILRRARFESGRALLYRRQGGSAL